MATLLKLEWKELVERMSAVRHDGKLKLGSVLGQDQVIETDPERPCILLINASTIKQVIHAREGGVNNMVTIEPGELFISDHYRHIDFMFLNEPSNGWAEPFRAYGELKGRRLREPRALYVMNSNIPDDAFTSEKKAAAKYSPAPEL
jgi:hypothetical protein